MRIGILLPSLHGGGAEYVARTWAQQLVAGGDEVMLYTFEPGANSEFLPAGVPWRHFEAGHSALRRALFLAPWVRRQAKRDQLDVLLTMMTFANIAGIVALARTTTPVVISERNMPSVLLRLQGRSGRGQALLARVLYRRAEQAIAISHPVAGDLVGGFGVSRERVVVVPNPVVAREGSTPRSQPVSPVILGYVGRLVRQKNPQAFIDVLSLLKKQGVEARGVVVGDGPERAHMVAEAGRADVDVQFLGWREEWALAATDWSCMLLPSLVEGFGNVLVEAASQGVPVVASSQALGVADAVVPGITGQLALTDRPEDLALAVRAAASLDPARPQLDLWLEHFSVEESTARLRTTLTRAAGDSR